MVYRTSSVPQLNSSGGSSSSSYKTSANSSGGAKKVYRPARKSITPTQLTVRKSNKKSSDSHTLPRSRSLTNGLQRHSTSSKINSGGSTSSSRNTPVFLRSRDNEIGSADTLEVVASKSSGSEPCTPDNNINVVVRVRPLNDKEKRDRYASILQFPGNGQIILGTTKSSQTIKDNQRSNVRIFTYNVVFEPGATQEDILDYSGIKRIIEMAIKGFSCTAFCYGQTGSGKTHTLTGPPDLFAKKPNPNDKRHGLIFRSFVYLFQLIKDSQETNFILKASFLEIYNERVIDLLNPSTARKPLAVRWSKKLGGFYVENLFTVDCEQLDDLLAVLEEGMRNRAVGSHAMNEHSSRSHTILTVDIKSEQETEAGVFISKHGKINFVDLAGSELTKKTLSGGKTLEEANNINKSLMVLGYCIASLSDSRKRFGHIPYRDSQLTKLLADSLAGNGVTLMIACVSPAHYNFAETLNTLRYASRAKRIRTKPVIMMDPREALILSLKRDLHTLAIENEHLKAALRLYNEEQLDGESVEKMQPNKHKADGGVPAPKVDIERLPELNGSELAELVKLYMEENETLREENQHLYTVRETILRDQEIVCRENERLLKKLEDVNSVCIRSPVIPAQPVLIAANDNNLPNSEVWRNPDDDNHEEQSHNNVTYKTHDENNDDSDDVDNNNKERIARNILKMAEKIQAAEEEIKSSSPHATENDILPE